MDGALLAGCAVLERAIAYALGSLALVTPPLLARPTPCVRWDLEALLRHLADSMAALREATEGNVELHGPAPDVEAVIPLVRDQAVRLLGAWAQAGRHPTVRVEDALLTAPLIAGAGAIEVTVHGWDVAQACGRPRPIPADLADELLDLAALMVTGPDRPGRFGRPLAVPGDAPAGDRLLAYLGRRG
jgi:uncharacterized protein (TIGR03086 family)